MVMERARRGQELQSPEKKLKNNGATTNRELQDFFEALESTVALLKIRNKSSTFSAVSGPVESLTKRRFLHSHLAKIKYLFPEAVECDSFTWKDPDSSLLKTDIRIRLLPFSSAKTATKTVSGMSRKWSADTTARRREFQKRLVAFEKDEDVPEAALLEEEEKTKITSTDTSVTPIPNALEGKVVIKSLYAAKPSPKPSEEEDEPKTPQVCKTAVPIREPSTAPGSSLRTYASPEALPKTSPDAMTPPKRQSVVKSLRFGTSDESKILDSIPDDLLRSVHEKEQRELANKSVDKRRHQMLSGLPHFLDMARHIFDSQARSNMLHKDLVDQIQCSTTKLSDKDEIEERLQLLLEMAPEWISSRTSLTGDTLYRVQKTAEFAVIRRRILDSI